MITIAVSGAKKTYDLLPNEEYEITGVKTIQNNSSRIIRVCESPIGDDNMGWAIGCLEIIGIDGGTVYINTKKFGARLEME